MKTSRFQYDVTFSFAEEDVAFVEEVVSHLRSRDVKYYFYKEDEIFVWGKKLENHLSLIYKKQSRLCVVFVSSSYQNKIWTKFELKNASKKALMSLQEYILPFKMDAIELPEISPTVKYLSKNEINAQQLADAIYYKITQHKLRDTYVLRQYAIARYYLSKPVNLAVTAFLSITIIGILLIDHLTPVNALTLRLYENDKELIKGSVCEDGYFSKSQGSGSCSSHGGVLYKIDTVVPSKTMEECHILAREISWLP